MTTYKGINGFAVQSVASDPSPLDEGQVWYNNATYAFKLASVTTAGTFAAGGNLNNVVSNAGSAGTQTAALSFGGAQPGTGPIATTELYNGTSWTTNPTGLNVSRRILTGTGTQTAALGFGGYTDPGLSSSTEKFNGTTWTTSGAMGTARYGLAGAGIQTATLAFGGNVTGNPTRNWSESFNGTSWTATPTLNTGRTYLAGFGTQTAAIGAGGGSNPPISGNITESWNGSSWTTVNSMNTQRTLLGNAGTQTLGVVFGGVTPAPANTGATELWNGTSWTSNPTGLATVRGRGGSARNGSQTSSLYFGGETPPFTNATEEWNGPGSPVTQTITTS